jgi:uncharacterized protein YfiM (DUF2279 family)
MKAVVLFFLFSTCTLAIEQPADSLAKTFVIRDIYIAKDKADHLLSSIFLTGFGYYAARKELHKSEPASLNMAIGFSFSMGIAKEVYDSHWKRGQASYKDLLADLLGTAVGFAMIKYIR